MYGNRSSAHYHLGHFEKALQDAKTSIQLNPNWSKGYYRAGVAHEALCAYGPASSSFKACQIRMKSSGKSLQERIDTNAKKARDQQNNSYGIIENVAMWTSDVFPNLPVGTQLFTLASFWNLSTEGERYEIFLRLLQRLQKDPKTTTDPAEGTTGPAGPETTVDLESTTADSSGYGLKEMISLPMENYGDMELCIYWKDFYQTLERCDEKVDCMEHMYDRLGTEFQLLVVKDIKTCITPGSK